MNASYFEALAFDEDLDRTRGVTATLRQHNLEGLVLPSSGTSFSPCVMHV